MLAAALLRCCQLPSQVAALTSARENPMTAMSSTTFSSGTFWVRPDTCGMFDSGH